MVPPTSDLSENLIRSEAHYRAACELACDYAYAFGLEPDGRLALEWCMPVPLHIGVVTPEEFQSSGGWDALVHPGDRPILSRQRESLLAGRETTVEYRILTGAGHVRWIRDYGAPVLGENEAVCGFRCAVREITQEKLGDEALQQQRQVLSDIQAVAPLGSWEWDETTDTVTWSAESCEMLGVEPEAGPRSFDAFINAVHPEDRAIVLASIGDAIDGNRPYRTDFRVVRPDGSERILLAQGVVRRANNGTFQGLVGTALDVTEHRRAEAALRESQERYHRLFDLAQEGIWVIDADSVTTLVNPSMAEMLGYTAHEMIGRHLFSFMDEQGITLAKRNLARGEVGIAEQHDFEFLRKDGARVFTAIATSPIFEPDGTYAGAVAGVINITPSKLAEAALRSSEERYRAVVRDMPAMICRFRPDGVLTFANSEFASSVKSEVEDLIGKNIFNHFSENEVGERVEYLSLLDTDQPTMTYEVSILDVNGATRYQQWTDRALFDDRGTLTEYQSVGIDITRRKQADEESQRAHRLESIGLLAGGLAHDFNNLLTAVLGNVSLARLSVAEDDDAFDILADAERATLRAGELTQQLLTFSKGGVPLKEAISIADLTRRSVTFALSGSNVRCEFDIAGDLWPADVDRGQIGQVLHNLALNADQAMPEGGVLRIHAENSVATPARPAALGDGRHVRISVRDEGRGIPEGHLDRVFDPYFTTRDDGSGIGLAIVYSIVTRHGGHVAIESEVGSGTTVSLYLPASDSAARSDVRSDVTTVEGRGRVLLVDDEPLVRAVVCRMLGRLGYTVEVADDGAVAVEMYTKALSANRGFDVVILDLTIPGGKGGLQTLDDLRRIDPGVRAVVSSGYSRDPVMANPLEYGFRAVVAKPYQLPELSQVMDSVLNTDAGAAG